MKVIRHIKTFPTLAVLIAMVAGAPAFGAFINVPNGNFNDNSDGDLADVDVWNDGDGTSPPGTAQVDNALDKSAGDLVMRLGWKFMFTNPTVGTGVNFDSTAAKYVLSVEARAFIDQDLTNGTGATEESWGFLFRDMTNGNNIKTATQPNPIDGDSWQTLTLELTQAEMLQYETDNSVDIDTAEIGVRFFKLGGTSNFVAVDNVTLELVPEPASLALLGLGGLVLLRRR